MMSCQVKNGETQPRLDGIMFLIGGTQEITPSLWLVSYFLDCLSVTPDIGNYLCVSAL